MITAQPLHQMQMYPILFTVTGSLEEKKKRIVTRAAPGFEPVSQKRRVNTQPLELQNNIYQGMQTILIVLFPSPENGEIPAGRRHQDVAHAKSIGTMHLYHNWPTCLRKNTLFKSLKNCILNINFRNWSWKRRFRRKFGVRGFYETPAPSSPPRSTQKPLLNCAKRLPDRWEIAFWSFLNFICVGIFVILFFLRFCLKLTPWPGRARRDVSKWVLACVKRLRYGLELWYKVFNVLLLLFSSTCK